MRKQPFSRPVAVVAICAMAGAAAGIAGSAASTGKQGKSARSTQRADRPDRPGFGGPPVHAELVALNKAGDKFITVTIDQGKVKSVSGNDLTITEGTEKLTYKDVTLTIPSDATIMRNGKTAKLSDFKSGDRVHVGSSSDGTFVGGGDRDFGPRFGRGHGHGPHGPGGPRRPGAPGLFIPGGPPPGAPAPGAPPS
jgi:hypothetical protein